MSVKIQFKRATKQSWLDVNPILDAGELGYETDTGHFKIGDGSSRWAAVQYAAFDTDLVEARLAEEHWHKSARLATNAVLPNSPTYTAGTLDADGGYGLGAYLSASINARLSIDGITASTGDRIVVVNQVNAIQNGLYDVDAQGSASSTWKLVRSADMNGSASGQITVGENIGVREGTVNHYQQFAVSSVGSGPNGTHIISADPITFVRITGTESFNPGSGLTVDGNTLNVTTADSGRIYITENAIDLAPISQNDTTTPTSLIFVNDVTRDAYGRVTGVTTASVQVMLGGNTTGDYVSSLVEGNGITIVDNGGEGSFPVIAVTSDTFDLYGSASTAYTNAYNDAYADATAASNLYADGLAVNYDPAGSASTAYSDATDYADGLAVNYDPAGAASTAYTDATEYADGLAANYDAAGAASTAYTDATEYADGLASNYDPAGSASTAYDNAVTYADGLTYSLGDLTDVTPDSETLDDVLVWKGTEWQNSNEIHLASTNDSTDDDSGALIVDGGVGIKKNLHVTGTGHFGGTPTVSLTNATAYFLGNVNDALQVGAQNSSSASFASADYIATADNGNDTSKYLDLGINSSTYSDSDYSSMGANDAYLYVDGGDLVLGTATGDTGIKFIIGGTQNTDIQGTWSEGTLDVATDFSVLGSTSLNDVDAGNTSVYDLTAYSGLFESQSASTVVTTVKAHSGQTANLTEWKNSAGTTLAHVDKDGKITAPVFVGTTVGNLSFYGINNTGSTISKGAPVVLTGLDSPSGNPTMTVANVADPAKMPAAGLAGADILSGATGEVIIIGQLHGVDTSSWTYNAILYVDGAGLLTTTKPTNPSHSVQPIGNVEKVATAINDGTILVNCTGTYADSPNTIAIPGSVTASAGFYGSGANITSLNANNLSSGTVPSARLSLTSSDIPSLTASKISDFATTAKGYTLDSFAVPVAAVAMNNQKITGMADPTSGADAATKSYVDNLSSGLRIKQAVNWATNAVLPNSPTYFDGSADSSQGLGDGAYMTGATNTRLSVDGSNVTTGQRVLVKNQATASHNGIYYVTEQGGGGNVWRLTRADDSNNTPAGEVRKGDYVSVLTGSANAGTSWTIGNDGTATTPVNGIKIGTDAINWIQFNGAASYVAGGGMTLSGTTFDVATASSDRIVINADSIDLATVSRSDTSGTPGGTRITSITTDSYGRVTGTVSSAQVDASTTVKGIASFDSGDFSVSSGAVTIKTGGVGNTQLENSSVTIGSSSVSLGGTTSSLTGLSSVSATTFTGNLTGNVTGTASTVTNGVYTTDTGTVTNTMLAGSIADSKLSTISTANKVSNSATTATDANTANAIVSRDASGNFTAGTITATLSGNASTATSATSATNATNAAITDTTTTAGTYYPVFSSTSTGNSTLRTDSTGLTYNPSTNALTVGSIATATHYIGTTQVDLNRASANLGLTGITSVAMPGSTSGTVTIQPTATAGSTTITFPATTGTVVTTGDSGTVTSTMIADGTIVNADISATAAIDLGKLADVSTSAQTSSYSLVLADKNKIVEMSNASANNLTVPLNSSQAFPVGTQINILQTGAGQTTVVATGGVTINGTPGLKLRAQWSYATLIKRATDTWVLVGDISA
jgi:hypothetical protein